MSYRYRLHGLALDSDVPLEAEPALPAAAPADLVIVLGPEREVPSAVPPGHPVAVLDDAQLGLRHAVVKMDGGWLIRFPRAAEVELNNDLTVAVAHLDPAFPQDLFAVLAAGFVVATVLQLRGDPVLHASAVEVDGSTLAVVGPSGTGKSTTASLLCGAGGRLVSDDVLRLSLSSGAPRTWRGPGSTRLRQHAASLAAGRLAVASADGRTVARYARASSDQLALHAVLLPRPRRDLTHVDVVVLSGLAALVPLVSSPRILGWCDSASMAEQLRQLSELSARVPVAEVHMPWGPPFSASLGADVVAALRGAQLLPPEGSSTA